MSRLQRVRRSIGPALAIGLAAATLSGISSTPAQATDWSRQCVRGPADRQAVFDRAAATSGVPRQVLLGVSFMESRWDDHGGAPSTSAGYGPMHLTSPDGIEAPPAEHAMGKGDGEKQRPVRVQAQRERIGKDALSTLAKASALTNIGKTQLKSDAVANVCGGAAVLADYQREAGGARDLGDWSAAVARYSGADDQATALRFTKQVFTRMRTGKARTTNDGQRVACGPTRRPASTRGRGETRLARRPTRRRRGRLPARPRLRVDPGAVRAVRPDARRLRQPRPRRTGRNDLTIDYIVIHDTEAELRDHARPGAGPDLRVVAVHAALVRRAHRPARRRPDDVAWHAGNWYVNTHSIGLEHEGFAADGRRAGTPRRCTARRRELVRYLAAQVRHPARPGAHHRPRPGAGHHARPPSPACTGTRARTGTGSTTSSCWARRSRPDAATVQLDS